MYFALLAELLLGVLAVFGLYTILRSFWASSAVCVALELEEGTTVEELWPLLARAGDACLGRTRLVALLRERDRGNTALLEALRTADVTVYFVEK